MTKGEKQGKGAMYLNNPKMCSGQIGMIQIMKQSLSSDMNDHIME